MFDLEFKGCTADASENSYLNIPPVFPSLLRKPETTIKSPSGNCSSWIQPTTQLLQDIVDVKICQNLQLNGLNQIPRFFTRPTRHAFYKAIPMTLHDSVSCPSTAFCRRPLKHALRLCSLSVSWTLSAASPRKGSGVETCYKLCRTRRNISMVNNGYPKNLRLTLDNLHFAYKYVMIWSLYKHCVMEKPWILTLTEVLTPSKVKLVQPHRDPRRWHWQQGAHGTLYSYAPVPGPKHRYYTLPWRWDGCGMVWLGNCEVCFWCVQGALSSLTTCERLWKGPCLCTSLLFPCSSAALVCWLLAKRADNMAAHSHIMSKDTESESIWSVHILCTS